MRPWAVIAGWAALLALWTALQWLFSPPPITLLLLGGAALAVLVLALLAARTHTPRDPADLSPATPLLALGAAAMVSGAELGTWCILLGALITAGGLFALRGGVAPVIGPLVLIAVVAGVYARGAHRVPAWRRAAFVAGLGVLGVAVLAPLEATLPAHMAQHLLLGLLAPLLLALGAPVRVALGAFPAHRRTLAAVLHAVPLRPWVGWAAWTAVMLGTHFTGVYELALHNAFVHVLEHLAYLGSGLLFWMALVAADPLPHPPGPAARLAWLLAAMPPMGLVGARLLTGTVAYPSYPDLAAQRTAAGLMWGAGSLLMSAALVAIVFAALLREEARQVRREAAR